MRNRLPCLLLLLLLPLVSAACIEGKAAPEPTPMAEIRDGLTFLFGDDEPCYDAEMQSPGPSCADVEAGEEGRNLPNTWPTMMVTLTPFAIDVHEVTNFQYEYCVALGTCDEPAFGNQGLVTSYYGNGRYADYPVVNVTWEQAQKYCAFVGKRLPTEFEWERVAGGAATTAAEKRLYPFASDTDDVTSCDGKDVAAAYCSVNTTQTVGVSQYDRVTEGGVSVTDLAGNVQEWVADPWVEDPTCEAALPDECDCFDCLPTDSLCQTTCRQCAVCSNRPAGAPEPEPGTPGANTVECFWECNYYPICVPYTAARECGTRRTEGGSTCSPERSEYRAFRGGSARTAGKATCEMRTTARANKLALGSLTDDIGFRCAKDL